MWDNFDSIRIKLCLTSNVNQKKVLASVILSEAVAPILSAVPAK
jgi:hypothetical protein